MLTSLNASPSSRTYRGIFQPGDFKGRGFPLDMLHHFLTQVPQGAPMDPSLGTAACLKQPARTGPRYNCGSLAYPPSSIVSISPEQVSVEHISERPPAGTTGTKDNGG